MTHLFLGDSGLVVERTPKFCCKRIIQDSGAQRRVHSLLVSSNTTLGRQHAEVVPSVPYFRVGLPAKVQRSLLDRARAQAFVEVARRVPRQHRSEERRVGKECRSRWSSYHYKKNEKKIIDSLT